ncbi:SDR family NAD(P)-dependent oxidoreductase [Acidocella sp.]|uniref:SDR family NAD(P)-dependent oxidoreductase n=1 Tax=Acidocella sp. TaxID=50710 RepID=UPI002631B0DA|nr:SDR family NAD(P)-dependent oxidoreductase [Acidocella sp.]
MRIEDHVFLVTGGASGLGAATARELARRGGKMVLADLNAAAGEALAAELGAVFARADVSSGADAQAAIAKALDLHGRLDGLVNCAGIGPGEKLVSPEGPHRLESFAQVINVNLLGTFNMLRLAAGAMAGQEPGPEGERGVIINTASIAAFDGQIGQVAYAASKAGVAGMTLPVARELARHGIRCVAIAPGMFATPMAAGLRPASQNRLEANLVFPPRRGRPEEFAALAAHIIENVMLNGEVIRLDGALRMPPK